jgi:hypothetical protein
MMQKLRIEVVSKEAKYSEKGRSGAMLCAALTGRIAFRSLAA